MLKHWINSIISLLFTLALIGCDQTNNTVSTQQEHTSMKPINFICALEKDHNPPLDSEADKYFQEARELEKTPGIRNWPIIISNYQQAVAKDHWKAMNNLANLYRTGKRSVLGHAGIEVDKQKMLTLYYRMVELKVPMGYYNWAVAIGRGEVPNTPKKEAGLYMIKAAELGYPMAQVALGNHYAFGLPRAEQRSDIAEQYFSCAGKQDNVEALIEVADFYYVDKENKPLAAYYYQKAASLGSYKGMMTIADLFGENAVYNFGYLPDKSLKSLYEDLLSKLDKDPDLRFPNLMKDHPLPKHPTQGYNADNPEVRPDY